MKLDIEVTETEVIISQEGLSMKIPRPYLLELVQALMSPPKTEDEIVYYYQNYGVAFSARSCRLIRSSKAGVPVSIVTLQRKTIPKLIEGLYSNIEPTYLGQTEIRTITSYLARSKRDVTV